MNLLLAGLGDWGQKLRRAIDEHPRAHLGGVVSSKVHSGVQSFSNLEEALDANAWDGVVLATPPQVHAVQLEECLARGIPTLVEKPLCLDLATAERLRELAHSTSVLVDHIYLFHPGYTQLKAQLRKTGSPPQRIFSEGGSWGPFRESYSALWDYGVHDLALHLDLMEEEPRTVRARRSGENFEIEMEFTCASTLIRTGNRFPERRRRLEAQVGEQVFTFEDSGVTPVQSSPLYLLIDCFVTGIEGARDERWGLDLAVAVTRVLSAIDESNL